MTTIWSLHGPNRVTKDKCAMDIYLALTLFIH